MNVGRPFPNKRAVVGDFPVRQPLCGAQKLFFSTEDKTIKDDEKKAEQAEIDVEGSGEETVATDNADTVKEEGEEEVNPLAEEVEKLKAEVEASKKKLLLAYAEMENVRAIARRDVDGAKTYAVQGFAKGLLDVADNLERALAAVPAAAAGGDPHLRALQEGVQMTDAQLAKVFAAHHLAKYGAVGDPFDPALHDAMFEYADPAGVPGTVGQLLKPGFKLHDRVIRPAQVGTIKAPGKS